MSDPFDYAPAGALRAAEADLKTWRDNVTFMLDNGDPGVIRAREGGGREDLVQSLVLTLNRTRHQRDALQSKLDTIEANDDGIGEEAFAAVLEDLANPPKASPELRARLQAARALIKAPEPSETLKADYAAYSARKSEHYTALLTPLIADTALHGQWHNASVRETLRAGVYAYNRLGNRKVTDAFGDDLVDAIVQRLIEAGWKPSSG